MEKNESEYRKHHWPIKAAVLFLGILVTWWIILQVKNTTGVSGQPELIWGASYQILALWGGIWGLKISMDWGGQKSVMGRAILAFAVGLLLQTFGQSVFSYYNLFAHVDVPYPSLADVGFFGSIPFYIYGAVMLAQVSGAKMSLKTLSGQLVALVIPLGMLALSYLFFLRGYAFDWSTPVKVFLDFGYPFGQAIYVSFAILAYVLTQKTLGGVMKMKVLFILLALVIQYLSDYNFLTQASAGTWRNGGYGDLLYLFAYFFMAVGLLKLHTHSVRTDT